MGNHTLNMSRLLVLAALLMCCAVMTASARRIEDKDAWEELEIRSDTASPGDANADDELELAGINSRLSKGSRRRKLVQVDASDEELDSDDELELALAGINSRLSKGSRRRKLVQVDASDEELDSDDELELALAGINSRL